MTSFSLITDGQLSAFTSVVRKKGFAEADFELQEEEFDQQTAEVEARRGDVGVKCRLSEAVVVYPLGDGSDWVANFAADLESSRFGQPSRGQFGGAIPPELSGPVVNRMEEGLGIDAGKPHSDNPGFSDQAWAHNAALYEAIRTMPFNAELAAGTLSEERFRHYITQDAHYLVGFGRALALAAAKAPNPDRIVQFAKAAEVAIVVERALHGSFFQQFAISPEMFAQTPLSPTCHHYVSYLLATAYGEPYAVVLGALLPCFWIYAEVGRDIHARSASPNRYQAWIDTYASDEFHHAVQAVIEATDDVARVASPAIRERMHAAFTRATQLEWAF